MSFWSAPTRGPRIEIGNPALTQLLNDVGPHPGAVD